MADERTSDKVRNRGALQRRGSENAARAAEIRAATAKRLDAKPSSKSKPGMTFKISDFVSDRNKSFLGNVGKIKAAITGGSSTASASESSLPRRPGQLPFIPPGKDTTPRVGAAKKPTTSATPVKSKPAVQVKSKPLELPAAQLQAEARERRRTKLGDEGRANRASPIKTTTHEHYAGRGYTPRTGRNKTTAELQRDRRK